MKLLVQLFLFLYGFFVSTLIIKLGFEWFISPMFDLRPITMVHALALLLFYNCFPSSLSLAATQQFYESKLTDTQKDELQEKKVILKIMIPWLVLGFLFLLHLLFDAIWL